MNSWDTAGQKGGLGLLSSATRTAATSSADVRRRPATTGRHLVSVRTALLGLVLAGMSLALVLFVARPGNDRSAAKVSAAPAFLAHTLGTPQPGAALERKPIPSLTATVTRHGYSISTPTAALGLDSLNGSGASWQRFANGAARPAPFGQESVSFDRFKVEQFSTVESHQGQRTWRWKLGTHNLSPRLRADGSVALLLPTRTSACGSSPSRSSTRRAGTSRPTGCAGRSSAPGRRRISSCGSTTRSFPSRT